jgi:hypothetical protein
MQTVHYSALISAVPLQDLLLVAIVFTLAALILFALAIEAGNYPKIRAVIRRTRQSLYRRLHRHWPGDEYTAGRRITGH